MAISNKAKAEALAQKLGQKTGVNICTADKIAYPYWLRRPTGIMQLDMDMGGGAPGGGITQLMGGDNSGKSMILFHMFAMQQRLYGEKAVLLYVPTEGPPDYMFMRQCGCQIAVPKDVIELKNAERKACGFKPFTEAERRKLSTSVGTFHMLSADNGEQLFDTVLDAVEANVYQIVGIDSMTVIQPKEELDKDMTDNMKKATHASIVTRFINRWHSIMNSCTVDNTNYTSVVATEQVRANQDKGMYNPAEYKPMMSYSAKHGASMNIFIKSESKLRSQKAATKGEVIGKTMKWETLKGKHGTRDNIKGEIDLLYSRFDLNQSPIDVNQTVLTAGLATGVIVDKGGTVSIFRANGAPMVNGIPTAADLVERLVKDIDLNTQVRLEIVKKHKNMTHQADDIESGYDISYADPRV